MDHFDNKFAFIENAIEIRMESLFAEFTKHQQVLMNEINSFEKKLIEKKKFCNDSNNSCRITINGSILYWHHIGSFYDESGNSFDFSKCNILKF